jgi:tetratricopeptide (TPR) repeat protein
LAADRIFVRLKETHPHYYTVGNLGDLDLLLGSLDQARAKYEEVAKFAVDSGDLELEAETTVRLAEHAYYSGDQKKARHLYDSAIQKAEEVGSLEFQIRGTIGRSRFSIGERDVADARISIGKLTAFAETTGSDRTRFEAEFLTGELKRIQGKPQPVFSHYLRCFEYATRQQQFELALKSLVRIAETQPDQRETARQQLRALLDQFRANNGAAVFEQVMVSRYFQFFHNTMRESLEFSRVATSP